MYCTINQLTNYRSTCLFDKIQSYILNKPISVVPIIDYSCQQYDNNSDWNKITICSFKVIPVMLKNYVLYNTCVIQLNTHSELVLLRLCGVLHAHFESLTAEIRVHHTGFVWSVWPACPLLFFGGEPPAAPRSLPTRTYFFFLSFFLRSKRPSRRSRVASSPARERRWSTAGGATLRWLMLCQVWAHLISNLLLLLLLRWCRLTVRAHACERVSVHAHVAHGDASSVNSDSGEPRDEHLAKYRGFHFNFWKTFFSGDI